MRFVAVFPFFPSAIKMLKAIFADTTLSGQLFGPDVHFHSVAAESKALFSFSRNA
jgi:hypothetical protein